MNDLIYRSYGFVHLLAKRLLGRKLLGVTPGVHLSFKKKYNKGNCTELWKSFILNSVIPDSLFHYAGYIEDLHEWTLPSWIWTNASIVRTMLMFDRDKAILLADALLRKQQECGGWIVRNDYDKNGPIPVLAPNDSAYIANNAMLESFLCTKDDKYLNSALKCADWIIDSSRKDGLVYTGYNTRDSIWDKKCIIVDTGFTAGLFARLYSITNNIRYRNYLEHFVNRYVELFFIPEKNGFCTSIDSMDRQQGGVFGRGQSWALEGLIPSYEVLKSEHLKNIIDRTVRNLISIQASDGGWDYNFMSPMMGQDCKGISVIARCLLEWYRITGNRDCMICADKAIHWCESHTQADGDAQGGIFSYSVEGGIVKNLYSSCAFVYASAYAIEVKTILDFSKCTK